MAASTFSISTVPGAGDEKSLVLKGRALPYQGLEFPREMRATFTWYPGNPVASVQMLGAKEGETTIKGIWKDRFLRPFTEEGKPVINEGRADYNGDALSTVVDIVRAVDEIQLAGQLLEVRWASLVSHGILQKFTPKYTREEDIEWEMTFQWVSRGERQAPVTVPFFSKASDFYTEVKTAAEDLKDAILNPKPIQFVQELAGEWEGLMGDIDDAALEIKNAVQNNVDRIFSSFDAAERTLTATQAIKDAANGIVDSFQSIPSQVMARAQGLSDQAATIRGEPTGLGLSLLADSYARDVKDKAQALKALAAAKADSLRSEIRRDELLASFTARAPTDLRDVSTRFYGTPDEWITLLIYNDLDSSELQPGQLILVPKISQEDGRT